MPFLQAIQDIFFKALIHNYLSKWLVLLDRCVILRVWEGDIASILPIWLSFPLLCKQVHIIKGKSSLKKEQIKNFFRLVSDLKLSFLKGMVVLIKVSFFAFLRANYNLHLWNLLLFIVPGCKNPRGVITNHKTRINYINRI